MAEKENNKDGVLVKGTSSADTITNHGSSVTVDAGGGADSVYNDGGKNLSISGGAGDDTVFNDHGYNFETQSWQNPDNATIDAGKGNDYVYNYGGDNVLFKYSGGNDTIYGFNSTSTLQIASGTMNSVITTNGRDYFLNVGKNTIRLENAANGIGKIVNSKGKALNFSLKMVDNFFNMESKTTVSGTANREILSNQGDKVIVLGNGGDDTISNGGSNVSVNGGAGEDTVSNYGSKVKVNGGAGDDYIDNYGSNLSVSGGAGNDVIYNYDTWNYEKQAYESPTNVTLDGGTGDDNITSSDKKETLKGGEGNDTLYGYGGNDKLYGGDDFDRLDGGVGNDSLWGGDGDDTLWGGDGKDVFIYKPGEGTDRIMDYTSGDMLTILKSNGSAGGSFTKSSFSDGTLTLNISGGGRVIFEDVKAGDTVNINNKTYTISGNKLK